MKQSAEGDLKVHSVSGAEKKEIRWERQRHAATTKPQAGFRRLEIDFEMGCCTPKFSREEGASVWRKQRLGCFVAIVQKVRRC
ncbi:MAG: hypothetical protein OEL83_00985 [Desulforhopalus sp.]|nr:hypothetical protein [Desulforhopalus sp.]